MESSILVMRKQAKLTRKAVADIFHVSSQMLYLWETGRNAVPAQREEELTKFYTRHTKRITALAFDTKRDGDAAAYAMSKTNSGFYSEITAIHDRLDGIDASMILLAEAISAITGETA